MLFNGVEVVGLPVPDSRVWLGNIDARRYEWSSYAPNPQLFVRYVESEAWTGVRWRVEDAEGNILALSMQTYDDAGAARAALMKLQRAMLLDLKEG